MQSYQKHPIYPISWTHFLLIYNFSKPVFRHIEEFINRGVQAGYRGKVTDIVNYKRANFLTGIYR